MKMNSMKTITSLARDSISRSPLRYGLFLIPLVIAWFAFSSATQAVLPPPDGGYPGNNTAEGSDSLFSLTTGTDNTAIGFDALYSNTSGDSNTAIGSQALVSNTTGIRNTATGFAALNSNTTGERNTATGRGALALNTTGNFNTADGHNALFFNSTGIRNTATGTFAMVFNTIGNDNTAAGYAALSNNTTGNSNTASGYWALLLNTTGNNNIAQGYNSLLNNTTGSGNIALGYFAGSNLTTGDNNIDIGNEGVADESNTIRIGTVGTHTATYIAGVMGKTTPRGVPLFINANGQLGTVQSSARFKYQIKPMDKLSEAILSLQPVTFHYKKDLDPEGVPQFGLVAEQVEKVNPDLVVRDKEGKPYSVRHDQVNAMLLNEFLKEHRKVQKLEVVVAQQQKQIEALTSGLQKVNAQLELRKSAPQFAINHYSSKR